MHFGLRHFVAAFAVLLTAACADAPTAPSVAPEGGPSEVVYGPGAPPACDPMLNLDWCEGGGGGGCASSQPAEGTPEEFVGVQGCLGPTKGGGGGTTPPPPPPADTTCLTGDAALDSPEVKQGLRDLWARSNPNASQQAQRLEQAAWIVQRPDGSFYMAPFTIFAQDACSVNGNFYAPPGAVAWVHTHPFTAGEVMTACGPLRLSDPSAPEGFRIMVGPDGQPIYQTYDNKPSYPDRDVMFNVNDARAKRGEVPLAGVMIDANQTTVYDEDYPASGLTVLPRCGY